MSKIVLVKNTITSSLKKIQANLDKLPQEAYDFYKSITPVRSGNAEEIPDSTKAVMGYIAQYAYAQRLDEGYSKQAPKGMSEPTEQFIAKRSKQIIKGK